MLNVFLEPEQEGLSSRRGKAEKAFQRRQHSSQLNEEKSADQTRQWRQRIQRPGDQRKRQWKSCDGAEAARGGYSADETVPHGHIMFRNLGFFCEKHLNCRTTALAAEWGMNCGGA